MKKQFIKNKKSFVWAIKLLLTLVLAYFCFSRFGNIDGYHFKGINSLQPIYLLLMFILLPINYYLEWRKWKLILDKIQITDKQTGYQSFFAGIVTGMFTPNMLGNFIGRMFYFQFKDRPKIVIYTLYNNLAQFLVTVAFGAVAMIFIGDKTLNLDVPKVLVWVGLVLLVMVYFFGDKLLNILPFKNQRLIRLLNLVNDYGKERYQVIFFSIFRYFVFSIQYFLVLMFFGAEFSIEMYLTIWILYLLSSLVPSFLFGKLGIRESISLVVFASFGMADYILVFTSLLVWIVNLLMPTIFGLIYCKTNVRFQWSSR